MEKYINGEEQFQVLTDKFTVDKTTSGYTVQLSVDGVNFEDAPDGEVASDEIGSVTDIVPGMYFRLKNNVDTDVKIIG